MNTHTHDMKKICFVNITCLLVYFTFLLFSGCEKNPTLNVEKETISFDTIIKECSKQVNTYPDLASKNMILHKLDSIQDSTNYYRMYILLSAYYTLNNRIDSAYFIQRNIIRFAQKQTDNNPIMLNDAATACLGVSEYMSYCGLQDSAIHYLQSGINFLYKGNFLSVRKYIPEFHLALAEAHISQGNLTQAVSDCRKGLLIADSLQILKPKIQIYGTLARIYTELKNFSLADQYFFLQEEGFDNLRLFDKYYYCNTRGYFYFSQQKYEEALRWFQKTYDYAQKHGVEDMEAPVWSNLGEVYLHLNQIDSAKYYLEKAVKYYSSPGINPTASYYVNMLYASLYLHNNDLTNVERLLNQHNKTTITNPDYVYLTNKRLEELYSKKGDYKKAYLYRIEADVYDDSIRNITAKNNIAEIDSRYMQDTTILKRDIIIAEQSQQVQQFRNTSVISILLLIIALLATTAIIIYTRRKKEKEYARQMAVVTQLRMENVRNRISPHFILNVLNSLIPGFEKHQALEIPVSLLTQSIKENLLGSEKIAIPLEEEMNMVKNYISLRRSINPHIPQEVWQITSDVNLQTLLPSMIIQIPVENALKHAFNSGQQEKKLSIDIQEKQQALHINIMDNGMGFSDESTQGTGQGLKILFKTIELLNSRNQHKIKFNMQDLSSLSPDLHGIKVIIEIPVHYKYDI